MRHPEAAHRMLSHYPTSRVSSPAAVVVTVASALATTSPPTVVSPARSSQESRANDRSAPAFEQVVVTDLAHDAGGDAHHDRAGRNVARHDRAGGDERF